VIIPGSALAGRKETYEIYIDGASYPVYLLRDHESTLLAVSSICTHRGCIVKSVRNGFECPCHGSEYDLTGGVRRGPAPESLKRFRVEEKGNDIMIELEKPG
jgi:Rieske Fe-S protein